MAAEGGSLVPRLYAKLILDELNRKPWYWPDDKPWPPPPPTEAELRARRRRERIERVRELARRPAEAWSVLRGHKIAVHERDLGW